MMRAPSAADQQNRTARILASVAATIIALSCGTNYGFSAWAPQFAERLQLTATETNLIGNFGNIGMYAMGIPGGILIDSKGPRWGVVMGCILLAVGYFPLKRAYDQGPGNAASVPMLCFFALSTGMGSCTAFGAAIKASASNWPSHRGTATAFPLSAFGLSAFFYTTLAAWLFPGDTSGYLKLLASGTTAMTFCGMLFLRIVPTSGDDAGAYGVVPEDDDRSAKRNDSISSTKLHKTRTQSTRSSKSAKGSHGRNVSDAVSESSSLVSSEDESPGDLLVPAHETRNPFHALHRPEITGWELLRSPKFWQLFVLLALLCGVGLMTINNIGNNARSLWHHYDDSASREFIIKRQLTHVSILSFCSFLGRLASGIGSDWLIHHHASRFWTLVASATIFVVAQCVALNLENPHHLYYISGLTGIAYGVLFGVYPALVADAFGATGLGINWGCMTWAPVLSGNFYNIAYGSILDKHSHFEEKPDGSGAERVCDDGRECYSSAYWITLGSSVVGVAWALWCIRQERVEILQAARGERRDHEP